MPFVAFMNPWAFWMGPVWRHFRKCPVRITSGCAVTQDLTTGEVRRARDSKLDHEVAVKVLPPALAYDSHRPGAV